MQIKRTIVILLTLVTVWAYGITTGAGNAWVTGKVSGPLICNSDSVHNYFYYLPTYYDEEEPWPVIFLFDPSGMGERALEAFLPGAEEFGYILAASNTTENGPWDNFLKGASALFEDVEQRFSVDPYRRYTAGFSGAAEAATGLAMMYDGIIGVIGCGAGFSPNYAPHFDIDFHYIGIIGKRDFHYLEMQRVQQILSRHSIEHFILEYDGDHEWPPSGVMRDAYLWMEFKAMKHYLAPLRDGLIIQFYNRHMQLADSLEAAGNIPAAYFETIKLLSYLDDLKRLDQVEEKKNGYLKSADLQTYMENFNQTLKREKAYTDAYREGFEALRYSFSDGMTPSRSLKWWKKQVKAANAMITGREAAADSLLGRRLIDFIWRNAYAYYKSVEGTDFYPVAIQYLDIWKMAQPRSISAYYFSGMYYAYYGRNDNAVKSLRQAVKNGLQDPSLIENEPILSNLSGHPGYKTLMQQLWAEQDLE